MVERRPVGNVSSLGFYRRTLQSVVMHVRPAPLAQALSTVLGGRRLAIETPQGKFWIHPLTHFGYELSRSGDYEPTMGLTLADFLEPGATFVDMGANEGFFTVIGAKLCGPSGRVVAIEPQKRLIPIIRENLRLNGLGNVSIVNAAVSECNGIGNLHLFPEINHGASSLVATPRYKVPIEIVETRTLAQILDEQNLRRVDFMKVDIEGSEWEMINGSPEVFATHRVRSMSLEIHSKILQRRGFDGADLDNKLKSWGYHIAKPPWVWTVG
jgi:FkbM family methyltransferase